MKLFWTPQAAQDRADIWDYLHDLNPQAALDMDTRFSQSAKQLTLHPQAGRPGLIGGTRELIPHQSYRLVYQLHQDAVWILALVHTARQWPPLEA